MVIPSLLIFSPRLLFYRGSSSPPDASSAMVEGISRSGELSCRLLLRHCPLLLLLLWDEVPTPPSKLGLFPESSLDGLLLPVDSMEAFARLVCIQAATSASSSASCAKTSSGISCAAPDLMTS
ncbi:hypothetical protein AAC387_Pa06g1805 [Persea americana]